MTKINCEARLALSQRQRRFEWQLARDEQTRAAARLVAGRTHDLLNLVQIAKLATLQLEPLCGQEGQEFVADLLKAADDAERSLHELMAVARPDVTVATPTNVGHAAPEAVPRSIEGGARVGAAIDATLAALRPALDVTVHLATSPDACTRCSREELEHLMIGLALDAAEHVSKIELFVRERAIHGEPWIEIVRTTPPLPAGDGFELRTVHAIAERAGGEVAASEGRGAVELIVALPAA
jgi:hypothetical protein